MTSNDYLIEESLLDKTILPIKKPAYYDVNFARRLNDQIRTGVDSGAVSEYDNKPYKVDNGIATIPISGTLINNFDYMIEGFATGYGYVLATYVKAMNDPEVNEIVLDINSPGGEAKGNFQLVEVMKNVKSKKVTAYCRDYACSGAYSIASVADVILAEKESLIGSIGVITIHYEVSKMLEDQGIKVTVTRKAEDKANVNMLEKLSEDAKKDIDNRINSLYNQFVGLVAVNRNMTFDTVSSIGSKAFYADEAIKLGLIDGVVTLYDTVKHLTTKKENDMGVKEEKTSDSINVDEVILKAKMEERDRIKSILSLEQAKGKEQMAQTLAFSKTTLDISEIVSILDSTPLTKSETKSNTLDKLMEKENINLDRQAPTEVVENSVEALMRDNALTPGLIKQLKGAK